MLWRPFVWLTAPLLLLLVAGCKREVAPGQAARRAEPQYETPALGEVQVQQMAPADQRVPGIEFDDKALTAGAQQQLEGAAIFGAPVAAASQTKKAVAKVLLGYAVEDVRAEGKALARAIAKLRVAVTPAKLADPYWAEEVEATAELPYPIVAEGKPSQKAYSSLVTRLIADLLRDYIARQKLRTASEAEIVTVITSQEGTLREEAMRQAGQRRLPLAVDPLLGLLKNEDETVRDAALGALLAMGERRAVSVLTASHSMHDRREMRKIVEAVALLGGPEATSYLEFVADAHEDEEIRGLAKRSLARLKSH